MSSFGGDSAPTSSRRGIQRRHWKPAVPGARRLTRHLILEELEPRTVLAAATSVFSLPDSLVVDTSRYDASRLLVRWKSEAALEGTSRLSTAGIQSSEVLNSTLWEVVLSCDTTVQAALASFRANPLVEYAEPDYTLRAALVP